jgi:hypothetical protein
MIATYRGHKIEVTREKCQGGWGMLYFNIFRLSDGYECLTSFEDSAETVRGKVQQLKERIDNELAEENPWGEGGADD